MTAVTQNKPSTPNLRNNMTLPFDTAPITDAPDMTLITSNRNTIKDCLPDIENIYLLPIKDELQELYPSLLLADKSALELLTQAPSTLRSINIKELMKPISTLEAQPQTPEVKVALNDYETEIKTQINSVLSALHQRTQMLEDHLHGLNSIEPGDVTDFITEIDRKISSTRGTLDEMDTAYGQLQEQENVLSTAMQAMEAQNLIDEVLPLFEIITKADPKNPALSAVRAAAILLQNTLRIGSDAIKYHTMLGRRDELQTLMNERQVQRLEHRSSLNELLRRLRQLKAVRTLSQSKASYIAQLRKITTRMNNFLNYQRDELKGDVASYSAAFADQADRLASHLSDLRKSWKN